MICRLNKLKEKSCCTFTAVGRWKREKIHREWYICYIMEWKEGTVVSSIQLKSKREREKNQQLEYLLWVMNWCQTWYFLASFYIHNNIFGCVWLFWSLRTKHRRCHRWTYLGNYNCTTDFVSSKVTFITFWNETGKRERKFW